MEADFAASLSATAEPAQSDSDIRPDVCCLIPRLAEVQIEISDALSSRRNRRGDRFQIVLAEPIIVNGIAVVPTGTLGIGEVVHGAGAGAAGRAGELILAARYLEHEGVQIPLRSFRFAQTGRDSQGLATGVAIAGGPLAFLVSGGNIDVEPGTRAAALIRENTLVAPVEADPVPQAATPTSEDIGDIRSPNTSSDELN